jgi:hypothetical protein
MRELKVLELQLAELEHARRLALALGHDCEQARFCHKLVNVDVGTIVRAASRTRKVGHVSTAPRRNHDLESLEVDAIEVTRPELAETR